MASLLFPRVCSYDAPSSSPKTFVIVLLSSVVNLCPHFLFIENPFDFLSGDSSKSFVKSFDSFRETTRIVIYTHRLRHLLEWIYTMNSVWVWMFERRKEGTICRHIRNIFSFWHRIWRIWRLFEDYRGMKVEPLLHVCGFAHYTWLSPVPELSFLSSPCRGWTRAGETRVQGNLHVHAQNEPIKNYQVPNTLLAWLALWKKKEKAFSLTLILF